MLGRTGVKGVIVGARNISHLDSNLRIPEIQLSDSELALLAEVLKKSTGPSGEVYYLERYVDKHRNIMHTNNN